MNGNIRVNGIKNDNSLEEYHGSRLDEIVSNSVAENNKMSMQMHQTKNQILENGRRLLRDIGGSPEIK